MMVGSLGILLNYIPIAKGKPIYIPIAGMLITLGTTIWFCINNFIPVEPGIIFFSEARAERFRSSIALIIVCYCLTHMSVLLLAYQKTKKNLLLIIAEAAIAVSGFAYVYILYGWGDGDVGRVVAVGISLSLIHI